MNNASHQPCNQMGVEPDSYTDALEAGNDAHSAPLTTNSASNAGKI